MDIFLIKYLWLKNTILTTKLLHIAMQQSCEPKWNSLKKSQQIENLLSHIICMRSIIYSDKVILSVDDYIYWYKKYFYSLYSDTGIFSEQLILDRYEEEAKKRHREILDFIRNRLTLDVVLGRTSDNTIFLPWRSKTLWFIWIDEGDNRVVTDLIIR